MATDPGLRPPVQGTPRHLLGDIGVRVLLLVVAGLLAALGAPWQVATTSSAVAALVTVERLVRHRRGELLDALAVAVGGLLVTLVLTGLLLDLLPGGLTRASWSLGLAAVGITGLLICACRPVPPSPLRGMSWRVSPLTGLAYVGAAMLVIVALGVSIASTRGQERSALQMSVRGTWPTAEVLVTSATDQGPFELLVDDGRGAHRFAGPFAVRANQTFVASVPASAPTQTGGKVTVSLANPGQTAPIRWVSVYHAPAARGAQPSSARPDVTR